MDFNSAYTHSKTNGGRKMTSPSSFIFGHYFYVTQNDKVMTNTYSPMEQQASLTTLNRWRQIDDYEELRDFTICRAEEWGRDFLAPNSKPKATAERWF